MEKIGEVLEAEKKCIYDIFEKKNALINLERIVEEEDVLYEEVILKLEMSKREEYEWWERMSIKNNWPMKEEMSWIIDFTTNEIYLV